MKRNIDVKIERYAGDLLVEQMKLLSRMRQRYFQEFPCLYKGSDEDTREYFSDFLADPTTLLAVARDGDAVIGLVIGTSMAGKKVVFQDVYPQFERLGWDSSRFYALSELHVTPRYRLMEVEGKLIAEMQARAAEFGMDTLGLMLVDRDKDDPRRPVDTEGIEIVFQRQGFEKTSISVKHSWPTIQYDTSVEMQENTLFFWVKNP